MQRATSSLGPVSDGPVFERQETVPFLEPLPPHWAARYGWLAGVSGPFLRKDQPTIQALGDTFSAFTPWDRKSEAEHVEDVHELMKTWRERHVTQEE